jgi:hypothetical protein
MGGPRDSSDPRFGLAFGSNHDCASRLIVGVRDCCDGKSLAAVSRFPVLDVIPCIPSFKRTRVSNYLKITRMQPYVCPLSRNFAVCQYIRDSVNSVLDPLRS